MNRSYKTLYKGVKHQLRRTLHHLSHHNCHHPSPDAYTAAGNHKERFIPSTQDLDKPPVEKPKFVVQTDGKYVRYTGP